ncbi:MAG: multicopper oxidase domain-containing protein [Candidatus Melainabacteria bacterium]|jgi:FtsP/CotA-like multicopper oxidase with cupredoxin domain|nr:multicopper oxidase domain-containing protein [Candidatus Melainabacteria bacterium]
MKTVALLCSLSVAVLCSLAPIRSALAQDGMAAEQAKEREELEDMRQEVGDIKATINDAMRQMTELKNQMKDQTYFEVHLFAKESIVKVASDAQISVLTYNGKLPGPELRFQQGDKVRLILHNQLKFPTSLHFHGMILPGSVDGLPRPDSGIVKANATYAYQFIANQPGTFWYHPQIIHGDQKAKGLFGSLVIEPKGARTQRADTPDKDVVLVIGDMHTEFRSREGRQTAPSPSDAKPEAKPGAKPDAASQLLSNANMRLFGAVATESKKSDALTFYLMNGKSAPLAPPIDVRKGQRVRLRIINSGHTAVPLHLSGHRMEVMARDGSDMLEPRVYRDTVTVNAGERVDVEFTADNPGLWALASEVFEQASREGRTPGGIACILRYTDIVEPALQNPNP